MRGGKEPTVVERGREGVEVAQAILLQLDRYRAMGASATPPPKPAAARPPPSPRESPAHTGVSPAHTPVATPREALHTLPEAGATVPPLAHTPCTLNPAP